MYLEKEIKDGKLIIRLMESHNQGDIILSEIEVTKEDLKQLEEETSTSGPSTGQ